MEMKKEAEAKIKKTVNFWLLSRLAPDKNEALMTEK